MGLHLKTLSITKIIRVGLIAFVLLFSSHHTYAAENNGTSPVFRPQFFSLGEKDNRLFILNGDNTVSIFDESKQEFVATRKPIKTDSNFSGIYSSQSGQYFAVFTPKYPKSTSVAIFKTEDFSGEDNPTPQFVYSLGWGMNQALFSPDEKELIVATSFDHSMSMLGVENNSQDKISFPGLPTSLTLDQKGERAFVISSNPNQVSAVDLKEKKITKTVDTEASPFDVVFDDERSMLFVSNAYSNGGVLAYNTQKDEKKSVEVGEKSGFMALDKKTGTVFVANDAKGIVNVIDTKLAVQNPIDLKWPAYQRSFPIKLLFSPATNKLVIMNVSASRYFLYDPDQKKVIKENQIPFLPYDILGNEANPLIFFGGQESDTILQLNLQNNEEKILPETNANNVASFLEAPLRVVIDSERERVYTANLGSRTIAVINEKTAEPITSFHAVSDPYSMVINTQTHRLYVASRSDGYIAVFDASDDNFKQLATIQVGKMPQSISIDKKNNKLYVANAGESTVSVIDAEKNQVENTIAIPGANYIYSSEIVGNDFYVFDYGGNSIFVIDLANQMIKKKIEIGSRPVWSANLPEFNQIAFSIEGNKSIVFVDTKSLEKVQEISLNATPYRLFYDGQYLYVVHRKDDKLTIIKSGTDGNAKIIEERKIRYLGELDTKFNMFAYDKKTNLAFITVKGGSLLFIAKNQPEMETNIMNLVWWGTIDATGKVSRSPKFTKTLGKPTTISSDVSSLKYSLVFGGVILIALLSLLWRHIRRRRRKMTETENIRK